MGEGAGGEGYDAEGVGGPYARRVAVVSGLGGEVAPAAGFLKNEKVRGNASVGPMSHWREG